MVDMKRGAKAPDFSLLSQDGGTISLSEFRGKKVMIFFYPKAMTSGCTKQARSVQEAKEELESLGVVPIGISPDPVARQKRFSDQYQLDYPLLSDEDHSVARLYGAWGVKTMYGKKSEGVIRSAFLISEDGVILDAWYKIKPEQTVAKLREALKKEGIAST
jgi:peroxiredoxin Q/BCP